MVGSDSRMSARLSTIAILLINLGFWRTNGRKLVLTPVYVSYPNAMRKLLLLVLLSSPVILAAQQTLAPMPNVIATYPVKLHDQLGPSCELIEPVTLIQYKQYDALQLAVTTDEIYSPELRKGDFVALSTTVPKKVATSAKKSGFDVRAESTDASGPSAKPMTTGSCPDSQQAIADANNRRYQRRVELQAHLHRVGFDVSSPVPILQVQPESANQEAAQSSGQGKAKEGTVILAMAVRVEGKVHDVQVVRSLDGVLDQKAIEAVRQWKFSPARMNGLPVPVRIQGEVEFRLH
jgi:TonB family protein